MGVVSTFLILLISGTAVAISVGFVLHLRKRGERLDAGVWFVLLTIGTPAVFGFVATLLGFK